MKKKIIDLSLQIRTGMQKYSNKHPKVMITKTATHKKDKREITKIIIGSHSGTHVDAPRHFCKNKSTIDKFPAKHFVGNAIILNFSYKKKRSQISLNEIKNELKNFKIQDKILIFRFDWTDKYYEKKNFYIDHPYLSSEACKWIVKSKVRFIGMDTPQPDNPNDKNFAHDGINHKILLSNNILIVEYLTNLKKIKKKNFLFCGAPLNIKRSDGSPLRAVGIF